MPGPLPTGGLAMVPFLAKFFWMKFVTWIKIMRSGVGTKFIWGSDVVEWDAEGMLFGYLEDALRRGEYTAAPEAMVIGNGLEKIQDGLNVIREGVSSKKVVVTLK